MLKKLTKFVRCKLLRVDWIKLEIDAYLLAQEKKRHHKRWAELLQGGGAIRDTETEKPDRKSQATEANGGVAPMFIDSTNWGGK